MDDRFVNLGEEVILTLLWQSGASEPATVCIVISLSICYWLFKCWDLIVVCVCGSEWVSDTVQVRVCERGRRGHTIEACLQIHTSIKSVSSYDSCFPLGLELMVKLRTLLTLFTFILKAKAHDYGKGHSISDSCLWCSANHNALCQLANQSTALVGMRDFVEN